MRPFADSGIDIEGLAAAWARLSPSDEHGAAITETEALGNVYPPIWPGYPAWRPPYAGWRPGMPIGGGGNIINTATGRGALTVVATGRPDVPLASAVGPSTAGLGRRRSAVALVIAALAATAPVLAAELAARRILEVAPGDRLAVQDPLRDLWRAWGATFFTTCRTGCAPASWGRLALWRPSRL